jgi:Putative bacterial sensory transduction regulator
MRYLIICTLLFSYTSSIAQVKQVKQERSYLLGLMDEVGYDFNTINDSLCQVLFQGDTLKRYKVNVLHFEDMVIIYVNLTKEGEVQKVPLELNQKNMQKVMNYNIHFDYLKFGIERSNGDFFVRADIFTGGLSSGTLRRFIDQVGRAANEIYPEMTAKN